MSTLAKVDFGIRRPQASCRPGSTPPRGSAEQADTHLGVRVPEAPKDRVRLGHRGQWDGDTTVRALPPRGG